MKRYFCFALNLFVASILPNYAQNITDNYRNTMYFADTYTIYTQSPELLSNAAIQNHTSSSLSYHREEGDLRWGQQAPKQNSWQVKTNGLYKNSNDFIFNGNISIEKSNLYGVGWNLSYMDVDADTGIMPDANYFAVSQPSRWNNQRYAINGGIVIPLLKNWDINIGTVYNLEKRFRSEYDPRPVTTYNQLQFHLGSSLEIATNHTVAFGGSWGYADVKNDFIYSNDKEDFPIYYKKYAYWMLGYGSLFNPPARNTKRDANLYDFSVAYHFQNQTLTVMLEGKLKNEEDIARRSTGNEAKKWVRYTTDTQQIKALLINELNPYKKLKINGEFQSKKGENFIYTQGGKNYSATTNKGLLDISILNYEPHKKLENLGVQLSYVDASQYDALSQTRLEGSYVFGKIYLQKEFAIGNTKLFPLLSLGYSHSLSNNLINGNESYLNNVFDTDYQGKSLQLFYSEVVYNDHNLWKTNQYELTFKPTFRHHYKNDIYINIAASQTYRYSFQSKLNHRWVTGLSISLDY